MAVPNPVESRLKFLKEAAYQLAIPSPATSAALGTARDRLLETQDADLEASIKEWDSLRREVCGACGSLTIPGWSCEISYETRAGRHDRREKNTSKQSNYPEREIVYSCIRCDRKTIQSLQPRPPKHTERLKEATKPGITLTSGPVSLSMENPSKVAKSTNASSKQRKKARKGGLQAMLEKNKSQSPGTGLGLDLMDFMR